MLHAIHSHIRLESATGSHHLLGYKSSIQVKAILGKCFTIWDFNLSEIWRTWGFEAPAQWRRLPRERWDHGSPSKKHPPAETAWPESVAGLTERTFWCKNIWYANRKETESGFLKSLEIFPNIRKIVFWSWHWVWHGFCSISAMLHIYRVDARV